MSKQIKFKLQITFLNTVIFSLDSPLAAKWQNWTICDWTVDTKSYLMFPEKGSQTCITQFSSNNFHLWTENSTSKNMHGDDTAQKVLLWWILLFIVSVYLYF